MSFEEIIESYDFGEYTLSQIAKELDIPCSEEESADSIKSKILDLIKDSETSTNSASSSRRTAQRPSISSSTTERRKALFPFR